MRQVFAIAIASVLICSCTKDYDILEPRVEMISATSPANATIELKARVTDKGSSDIRYVGFCYSLEDSVPQLSDNQLLLNGTNGEFTGYLYYNEESLDIYFRPFAANEHGYAYGDIVKFTTPPFLPPQVPCNHPLNTFIDNSANHSVSTVDSTSPVFGAYAYNISTNGDASLFVEFNRKPTNGTYHTVSDERFRDGFSNDVRILVKRSNFYLVNTDQEVYVTRQSNGKLLFEACDLQYRINQFDLELSIATELN